MIKKQYTQIISGLTLVVMLSASPAVIAQTAKPTEATQSATTKTVSPSAQVTVTEEIQDLKEKIATKVAELRKKNQRAVAGIIIAIKDLNITIKTDNGDYDIKVDEALTKVYTIGTTKKEIKAGELKKDSYIIVTGPMLDKTIDANYIYQDEQFIVKAGKITDINKDDFYIKVLTTDKDTYTLDIENSTTQQLMDIKTLSLDKIGFSKLKEGDTIHFVFKKTGTEKEVNRYTALRVVVVPQEYFQK